MGRGGGGGSPELHKRLRHLAVVWTTSFSSSIYICQVLTFLCATGSEQRCVVGAHYFYIGDLELYNALRGLWCVQGIIRLPKPLAWPHMAW